MSIKKVEGLVSEAKRAADSIRYFAGDIRIVSHYDADGIASAAIMAKALYREGKSFHLSIIKQLGEDNVKQLRGQMKSRLIAFLDMGSGQLESIRKHLLEGTDARVIICDHHQAQGSVPEEFGDRVFHINPTLFDIEENISGSGVTYLLARALNPDNRDLSELGIIGAIGDSQTGSVGPHWGLLGLNKEIMEDAKKTKKIKVEKGLRLWGRFTRPIHKALEYSVDPCIPGISGSESACIQFLNEIGIDPKNGNSWRTLSDLSEEEQRKLASGIIKERIRGGEDNPDWIFGDVYELLDKKDFSDANEFATLLNATGKLKEWHMGLALCLNDGESFTRVKEVLEAYRKEIGKALNWLCQNRKCLRATGNANYVLAGGKISEHVISNVASILKRSDYEWIDRKLPIFAMVDTEDGKVKISARADDDYEHSLKDMVSRAAEKTGGEGGGHNFAAGATIPRGKEDIFINTIEEILKNKNQNNEEKPRETPEKEDKQESGDDGRGEERPAENEGDGREGKEEGRVKKEDGREEGRKEMERKGLVRYFGA